MKVQSVDLKYFKKFRDLQLDFTNSETGLAKDLIVLIGINSAGKTSILQAIASTLGVATGRLKKISDLQWSGFNYELLSANWRRLEPQVNIKVEFSSQELQSIKEFHQKIQEINDNFPAIPNQNNLVNLYWKNNRVQANSSGDLFQFKGREYAKYLTRSQGFEIFEKVGTIFWYTEQRTSTSLTSENTEEKIEITEDKIRHLLSSSQQFHESIKNGKIKELRPGQKDLYAEIEKTYQAIFPNRSFDGVAPRENIDDIFSEFWFNLYDGKSQYEISEMSGGERAVFPILMDFANWNIHNSIILIDEIELHLHPPMQQALLKALPKLGKNNQFIITTHSDYIEQLVPNDSIIWLDQMENF